MKRAGFVCLYLFFAATLVAQSDSGSVVDPPSKLLRPVPDFQRLVPSVGEGRKLHMEANVSRLDSPQSAALSFAPIVDYNSGGEYAQSMAVSDLNRDGKPDVVVADRTTGQVGVLLGNGDGTFQPVVIYSSGEESALSVAIADVNEDGINDLLVAGCGIVDSGNCTNGVVSVLLGNGDGTFQGPVSYGSGGQAAEAVAVADLNGDGRPDLVVANSCPNNAVCNNSDGVVSVLLGNGDGTFQAATTYDSGGQLATSVAVADLNGDGRPDVVVANYCLSGPSVQDNDLCQHGFYTTVGVLLGNGDGTFQAVSVYNSGGYYAMSAAIADLNGDGKPDLVIANGSDFWPDFQNGSAGVLLGNGDGTFQPTVPYAFPGYGTAAAVTDMNGDGKLDLVMTTFDCNSCANGAGDSAIGVLVGNGDGTLQPAVIFETGGSPRSIAKADINADGRPDLLLANGGFGVLINTTAWPTAIALSTSYNPSNFGQSLTFTASVTSKAAGTPTGIVTFSDGSTPLGSFALSGETATLTTAALVVGPHSISAVYSGDSNFSSSSASLKQTVNQAITTLTLTSSINPSGLDQPVTFTAMISPQFGGEATGAVTFKDGATTLGSVAVSANAASLIANSLAIATHPITAFYGGDGNFIGSTSNTLSLIVTKATTTAALLSSLNPSVSGKSVTFTAIVSSLAGTPTGKVEFLSGPKVLATVMLTSGSAKYSTSKLPAGFNSITAVYAGDSNNDGSTSAPVNQFVIASTTTTLTSAPGSSIYGQTALFTATIMSSIGTPPDGETVTFELGATVLGTGTLSGGTATSSYSGLGVGTKSIKAVYGGDANFAASTSKADSQVVGKATSTTTLGSAANPSNFRQSVTLTATVAPQFSGTPTGSVVFKVGTKTLKTVTLSGGVARYTTSTLAAGVHNITATYNGSTDFTTSSGSVTQTVN